MMKRFVVLPEIMLWVVILSPLAKESEGAGPCWENVSCAEAQSEPSQAQPQPETRQDPPSQQHPGHHGAHGSNNIMTTITGGPFKSMRAIGSGTSLQPASSPVYGLHFMPGPWKLMLHGELKLTFNHQGAPRGITKAEAQNWLMLMAERNAGAGRVMLRGMFSAEPLTAPHGGFPQLFQTGETYRGQPIIDAQHPHDLIMELAASYSVTLAERASFQIYGGPVGEPALGPVAFMHRASAAENPAAPLGHHWQDSSHITHGVVTAALNLWNFKFEGSVFHGAEPDENRATVDFGELDSYSLRAWFAPTPNWAAQFSFGHLTNPEAIEEGNLDRLTASISYNRPLDGGNWASTLIWGRNAEEHGNSNSYLVESTLTFLKDNHFYTRLELSDKQGLLADNIFGRPGILPLPREEDHGIHPPEGFERFFRIGGFTFGGVRDIISRPGLRLGIGADVTFYHMPDALKSIYGSNPTSFHVFVRLRPGKMEH